MAFGIDRSRGAKNICVTESSDSGTNDNIILMDGETLSKAISLHSLSIDPSTLFQLKMVFLESLAHSAKCTKTYQVWRRIHKKVIKKSYFAHLILANCSPDFYDSAAISKKDSQSALHCV